MVSLLGASVFACPFCSVESQTLSEETQSADAVVLAKLLKEAPPVSDQITEQTAYDPNSGTAIFEVVEVLRGEEKLQGVKEINVVYFGEPDRERVFLVVGLGTDALDWTTPLPLSPTAVEYVKKLPTLAESGADRLAFFQEYLEHEDPLLAQDAYDEFARAPYDDVKALGPRMHHDKLLEWITSPQTSPSRKRLYFTMLGVCGTDDDLPLLESMIVSDFDAMKPFAVQMAATGMALGGPLSLPAIVDVIEQDERAKKLGLDALVACYLQLRGPDGLQVINKRFLTNKDTEYTYIYSTIMALRFHGDEDTGVLPREQLLSSMRLLLDNPDFADQVILDLSRWEDWSVLDRLTEMFKTSDETGYVRQPIVTYLTVASDQPGEVGTRAASALEELEAFDPETVKQARSLMAFGALSRARGTRPSDETSDGAEDTSAGEATAFAASAEDRQSDAADIPDPAAYEQPAIATASTGDQTAPTEALASATTASTSTDPAVNSTELAEAPELNRVLLVGVPIGAAALLMGIYWLILRAGAV